MSIDDSVMSSVRKGNARFKTPAPRQLATLEDPLRYLKKTSSRNESIPDYIDSSRKILKVNVGLMENQEDVDKLKAMIVDEESKLAKAKTAFKEDSQRFQTYLFQTKQDNERIEEQFKDANRRKKELEAEESKLRARIEHITAEINTTEKNGQLSEDHLHFLD